ncbi:MAG: carbohydrate ABC transporter permease [Bacilli bacterium]|nr:carbohydrate ABC transporter permease [Bacilli bacterium]
MTKDNKFQNLKKAAIDKYNYIKEDLSNPLHRAVKLQKVSDKAVAILRAVIIFGLAFIIIFPIFQQISLAFRHPADLNDSTIVWIPKQWSLINFEISIKFLNYWKSLWNNIRVSTIVTICQIACTSLAGYAFARLRFKGSNILFWLIMLTLIIPPQAFAVSRMLFFSDFDIFGIFAALRGSDRGLTIGGAGKDGVFYLLSLTGQGVKSALFVYLFRQFFRGLPLELEESAQIDGAGILRTFWSVMLPNARGVVTTVALFAFVWQWNDVYYTQLLGVNDDKTFPLLTMQLLKGAEWAQALLNLTGLNIVDGESQTDPKFTALIVNTAAFISMLPLLLAYLFVQRLFVEGIERTGIVG